MAIDLTHYKWRDRPADDRDSELDALQARLGQLQLAQIVHRRRLIIAVEGWVGSGRKAAIRRLLGSWDPCYARMVCNEASDDRQPSRHWLSSFWAALPAGGETSLFFPSWYKRILERRAAGTLDNRTFARACDEINEFEAQQLDHDTLIIKLFFHMSADQQAKAIGSRQDDPWRRNLLTSSAITALGRRDEMIAAVNDLFEQTDTRWAPWRVVDGNDELSASVEAMTIVAEAMEAVIPNEPPAEDLVIPFAAASAG